MERAYVSESDRPGFKCRLSHTSVTLSCLSFPCLLLELLSEAIDEVNLAYGVVLSSLWKNVGLFLLKGSL